MGQERDKSRRFVKTCRCVLTSWTGAYTHSMAESKTRDRSDVAFPHLTAEQIERIAAVATPRTCDQECVLFDAGERAFHFYVVLEGRLRMVERTDEGDRDVAEHDVGQFSGDTDMLSGQPSVVAAIAEAGTTVLCLDQDGLGDLMAKDSELSDIVLQAFLMRRELLREQDYQGVRLIGSRWSKDTHRLKDFLSRQGVLFRWMDLESDTQTDGLLKRLGVPPEQTPVVVCRQHFRRNPSNEDLAKCLGIAADVDREQYDLVVVGAGPAGLAAAVYGASEGLSTLVVEANAPGGQAGTSSKIENYLGFPTGISGSDLAQRAVLQARKFRATITSPRRVVDLGCDGGYRCLTLDSDEKVWARGIVIATGADYRRLDAEGGDAFEGSGIYYGATQMEATLCQGSDVIVVGGGNSAGQAAVFLSGVARSVRLLIRGDSLASSMSRYLIDRIDRTDNIHLLTHTQITAFHGNGHLESVDLQSDRDDVPATFDTPAVFVMIGASPRTDWLKGHVMLDNKGFVVTGSDVRGHCGDNGNGKGNGEKHWDATRDPYPLETSRPGVFAAGDARSGSIKRVASAVGEGAMAVSFVHQTLAATG